MNHRLLCYVMCQVLLCILWQGVPALLASVCAAVHRRHLMMCVQYLQVSGP